MKNKFLYQFSLMMIVVMAICQQLSARTYFFHHYDTSHGLSHNTVNDICQDKNGFMWFATKDGLNRFDGKAFRIFRRRNSGLGNNFINKIYEDSEGSIWIATERGVFVYHSENEQIEQVTIQAEDKKWNLDNSIRFISGCENGDVNIASVGQGLLRYNPKTHKLCSAFKETEGRTVTFCELIDGIEWVGVLGDNLYYKDLSKNKLVSFRDNNGNATFANMDVNDMQIGGQFMFVATDHGLYSFNRSTFTTECLADGFFRVLEISDDGQSVWAGSQNGIYVVDVGSHELTRIVQPEVDEPFSISDNAIYALCRDKEGGMWIGSYFGGVNFCPVQQIQFSKYYPRNGLEFMGRRVREMCQDESGIIWIGTEDRGLLRYQPDKDILSPYTTHLRTQNIHGLCADNNFLWVGAFDGGLERVNTRTGEYKTYFADGRPGALCSNYVFSLYKSSDGILWIGTPNGLMRYNRENDSFVFVEQVPPTFVYHITEDAKGNIWMASYSEGVYVYQPSSGKTTHYAYQDGKQGTLSDSKVIGIYRDSKNRMWVMTHDGGIARFNEQDHTFSSSDLTDATEGSLVFKVVEDSQGNYWCSTNNGLVCYNPVTKTHHCYTIADGLQTNQFNYQSGLIDRMGNIYFGNINGFVKFKPYIVQKTATKPRIAFSALYINNKLQIPGTDNAALKENIDFLHQITLAHNQRNFSLLVVLLSYVSPQNHQVQYMLEGVDRQWRQLDENENNITYANLPYGNYVLQIRANADQDNEDFVTRSLQIYVKPPFYLSAFAKIFYILLALALVSYVIYRFVRHNRLKFQHAQERLEQEKQKELYDSKISFFTNIAHEIRTPLTLIKGPLDNILNDQQLPDSLREDLNIMEMNTGRLMSLVNQLLDFRKTEANGMRLSLQKVNVSEVMNVMIEVFSPAIKEKGLLVQTDIQPDVWAVVDRDLLGKIFSNILSNAMKYADKKITLSLSADEEKFTLVESNDGLVVPLEMREEIFNPFSRYSYDDNKSVTGTGLGLALTRSLVGLHKGELLMDDDITVNRFVLRIPLQHESPAISMESSVVMRPEEPKGTDRNEPAEENIEEAKSLKQGGQPALLFVEDNQQLAVFLSHHFEKDYKVFKAGNGKEALEILDRESVNLIVSDIMMPEVDGLELCDTVKRKIEYSHIPVILLTAKTNDQSRVEGLRYGADAYIDKPFSMPVLEQTIQMLIENRKRLYESFMQRPMAVVTTIVGSDAENEFLSKLGKEILEHLDDSEYDVDQLASAMNMSKTTLNRKIKSTINMTPNDYIRRERLRKATELIKTGKYKINEVCYMVGFNTPSYFAKCYQKQYGVLPSELVEMQ